MNKDLPYLSIIIPCYNVADYIPMTIQSLSQLNDAEDCEFIFINDGSTDDTLKLIESFAKKDKRVILIDQKNQGVSVARNHALQVATGKYVLCLDGDDFLVPETIAIIRNHIASSDVLLAPCFTVQEYLSPNLQKIEISEGIYSIDQFYAKCKVFPTAPKLVYRTSIIKRNQLIFDPTIKSGEVYTFTVDFFKYARYISVTHNGFYNYVMRSTSATHMPNFKADLSVLKILDHFTDIEQSWSQEPSFMLTALKMIMSFTYNKYSKLGLLNIQAIETIDSVLHHTGFKTLLHSIPTNEIDFKHRIFIQYLRALPPKFGYKLCTYAIKLMKNRVFLA